MRLKYRLSKKGRLLFLLGIFIIFAGVYIISQYNELRNMEVIVSNVLDNQIKIVEGEQFHLDVKASRKKYDKHIKYKSNNSDIVKIDNNGTLEALKIGTASIDVWVDGSNKINQVNIDVGENYKRLKELKIDGILGNTIYLDQTYHLIPQFIPSSAKEKDVIWHSSDESIATINDKGELQPMKPGKVKISLSGVRNIECSVDLLVEKKREIKTMTIKGDSKIDLETFEKFNISFKDVNKSFYDLIEFSSSNKSIATINKKGEIKAIRPGIVTINAKAKGKKLKTSMRVRVVCNKGLLTKQKLINAGINNSSKLMIVAHPDDETLWGGGHLLEGNWFVICLTNEYTKSRKKEFYEAMKVSQSNAIILSYPDIIEGKRDDWSTVQNGVYKDIQLAVGMKNWQQIATHNPLGDTGHQHHKKTNQIVTEVVKNTGNYSKLWYTGKFYHAGKVPSELKPTNDEQTMIKKNLMISKYIGEKVSIDCFWRQMMPYEHWKKAEEWE